MKKILSLLLILLVLVSCSRIGKEKAKILSVSLTGEVSTLDPVNSYDTISGSVVYQCYEQLYEYHYLKRPYAIQPLLATQMPEIDRDGKRYTIKIRSDVKYHRDPAFKGQTRFVTSSDFVNAIKRMAFKPFDSSGWWTIDGLIVGINEYREKVGEDFNKMLSTPIKGISTPDEQTLVIELTSPSPSLIYKLALSFFSPIPSEALVFYKNDLSKHVIGTGPFVLADSDSPDVIRLVKNPEFHSQLYPYEGDRFANAHGLLKDAGLKIPFLDEIHFNIIKEQELRWKAFLDRKIDFANVPKESHKTVVDELGNLTPELKEKKIKMQNVPTSTSWWLAFNMNHPLLGKNLNLRKAFAYAIDIDNYIKTFTNNNGQKANSIYMPGVPGYRPSSSLPYEFNLELAKKYLADAGYPEGKKLPAFHLELRGKSQNHLQQGEMIKSQLAKIGIKIELVSNDFPTFLEKSRQGKLDFFIDGWSLDYPDSENILQLLASFNKSPGPNATFYHNNQFDGLYGKLSRLPIGQERESILIELENIVNRDIPWIMMYYARNLYVYHDHLKNFRYTDVINNYYKYLKISQE